MMEAKQITKNMLDIQKGAFSSWCDLLSIFQDQTDLTVNTILDQAQWMPNEGRKALLSWVSACKKEGDRYKTYVADSFSGVEKFIAKETNSTPAKPAKKTTTEKKVVTMKPKAAATKETVAATAKTKAPISEKKDPKTINT